MKTKQKQQSVSTLDKEAWQQYAMDFLVLVATASYIQRTPFTSNDLWRAGLKVPENRRWLGPVMKRAERAGLIRRLAGGVLSEHGHGSRMNSVWIGA